jgi:hypothetical protein
MSCWCLSTYFVGQSRKSTRVCAAPSNLSNRLDWCKRPNFLTAVYHFGGPILVRCVPQSRDYPFHEVDLGPKLDAAPISREQANQVGRTRSYTSMYRQGASIRAKTGLCHQALATAMRLPEAMTELSALLHCSKGAACAVVCCSILLLC